MLYILSTPLFGVLFVFAAFLARNIPWISIPTGLALMAPFTWAMVEDYYYSADRSIGAILLPVIMGYFAIIALAGAILFMWGMSRLKPRQRINVLGGIIIAAASTGAIGYYHWSQANIPDVVANAESIAGDRPYCIDVPSGNDYRQAVAPADFAGSQMHAPHQWGWYAGPHAILALGSGLRPDTYHWSYGKKSFILDTARSLELVHCQPRAHFAKTMSENKGPAQPLDEFRFAGRHFAIPSVYRSRIPYGGGQSIAFYATAPGFAGAPEAGWQWSEITVSLADAEWPDLGAALDPATAKGTEFGLKKHTGSYGYQYVRVASDGRVATLITCPGSAAQHEEYCKHTFRTGGWIYTFYHKPGRAADWKNMEEKLVKLTRSFVKPAEVQGS